MECEITRSSTASAQREAACLSGKRPMAFERSPDLSEQALEQIGALPLGEAHNPLDGLVAPLPTLLVGLVGTEGRRLPETGLALLHCRHADRPPCRQRVASLALRATVLDAGGTPTTLP